MARLVDVFNEKERTNWLKAWLAVEFTKSGLEQFVDNEARILHYDIYKSVWNGDQWSAVCTSCDFANLIECPTEGICKIRVAGSICPVHKTEDKRRRPCPFNICERVLEEIKNKHRYKDRYTSVSWKNTSAYKWGTEHWEIAKCYFPEDGYAGKRSVQETDLNGIISFMLNCTHFDTKFSFRIATRQTCLLTKAREIGRTVRHSSECKVTDTGLNEIFTTLINLLTDTICLAQDNMSTDAVQKLKQLKDDTLSITRDEICNLLEAVDDILKIELKHACDNSLSEFRIELIKCSNDIKMYLDKCKTDIDAHTGKRKNEIDKYTDERKHDIDVHTAKRKRDVDEHIQEFDQHVCKQKQELDQHIRDVNEKEEKRKREFHEIMGTSNCTQTKESNYDRSCEELIRHLKQHYDENLCYVTPSPLDDTMDEHISSIYMTPKVQLMKKEKGTFKVTGKQVKKYEDVLFTDYKANQRIFLQGEAGSGKTTFTAYLVLDWCGKTACEPTVSEEITVADSDKSTRNPEFFDDRTTLEDYKFVFHITLRDSVKEYEIPKMIKEQIIDSIYSDDDDREKAYKLLNEIMKHERCLIVLDGLDEWIGPGDNHPIPSLVASHNQCVLLITTRPWKLADGKIKHSKIKVLLQLEGVNKPFDVSRKILSCRDECKDITNLQKKQAEFESYIKAHNMFELLSSPMMLYIIVCSWADGTELKGSKCEIYTILLEGLLKKANNEEEYFQQAPFRCFTQTQYIQPNIEQVMRLANAAFHLLFSDTRELSVVFTLKELKRYQLDQGQFELKAGIFSKLKKSFAGRSTSSFSFIHKSVQEFVAAVHIASYPEVIPDVISEYLLRHRDAYLEISQVFIFLCGLNNNAASTLSKFMNERHASLDREYQEHQHFQGIIMSGYRESLANEHSTIQLNLSHYQFMEDNWNDLHNIWKVNKALVLSLEVYADVHVRMTSESLSSTLCQIPEQVLEDQSGPSISNVSEYVPSYEKIDSVDLTDERLLQIAPNNFKTMKRFCIAFEYDSLDLSLFENLESIRISNHVKLLPNPLPSHIKLKRIELTDFDLTSSDMQTWLLLNSVDQLQSENVVPVQPSILSIDLFRVRCSSTWLHRMFDTLLTLDHQVNCFIQAETAFEEKEDIMHVWVEIMTGVNNTFEMRYLQDSPSLWKALHSLKIKNLSVNVHWMHNHEGTIKYISSFSKCLSSLTELETLRLDVSKYIDIQLPNSVKHLIVYCYELSPLELDGMIREISKLKWVLHCKIKIGFKYHHPERYCKVGHTLEEYKHVPALKELVARERVTIMQIDKTTTTGVVVAGTEDKDSGADIENRFSHFLHDRNSKYIVIYVQFKSRQVYL